MAEKNVVFQLLCVETKAELDALVSDATVTTEQLAEAIFAAELGLIGWAYNRIIRDVMPEDVSIKEKDYRDIPQMKAGDEMGKLGRKITHMFNQRRKVYAHVFYVPRTPYWMILNFDNLDITQFPNHWGEPHVHMLCDLTHPRQGEFEKFIAILEQDKQPRLPHPLHIRFSRSKAS